MSLYKDMKCGDIVVAGPSHPWRIACCSCGLVHELHFQIKSPSKILIEVHQLEFVTTERRRSVKKERKQCKMTAKKGVPKRDGSGKGVRANRGRGGCKTVEKTGKGRNQNK